MMGDCVRRCRVRVGATASFIDPWCNNRGGKAVGPCRCYKKTQ
jgi:hypothetical protein